MFPRHTVLLQYSYSSFDCGAASLRLHKKNCSQWSLWCVMYSVSWDSVAFFHCSMNHFSKWKIVNIEPIFTPPYLYLMLGVYGKYMLEIVIPMFFSCLKWLFLLSYWVSLYSFIREISVHLKMPFTCGTLRSWMEIQSPWDAQEYGSGGRRGTAVRMTYF